MAQAAAAAPAEVGTVGGDAAGRWLLDPDHVAPDGGAAYFIQVDRTCFAPEAAGHKDHRAVEPGDAVAVAGITLDEEGMFSVF